MNGDKPTAGLEKRAGSDQSPPVARRSLLRQRLLTLFSIALVLLFSPLVGRHDLLGPWLGIPSLDLYLYGVWALVILGAAWITAANRDDP